MKRILLGMVALMMLNVGSYAQQRYLSEIYTDADITVERNVTYGSNMSILTGTPASQTLLADIYYPDGSVDDTEKRPLAILLHNGNFLPPIVNGSAIGMKEDKAIMDNAMRLAKRGYVVAAISYRLGWNPISDNQEVRVGTLLQAVYRAILDTRTAIRYFRKTEDEGNAYAIDVDKIIVVGHGTGGYVALGAAHLSDESEIELAKFINIDVDNAPLFVPGKSYVITDMLGKFDGSGGNPAFNTENHLGYSSDFHMAVNLGGALADTSWINPGEPAVVSFQCIRDPFGPFNSGTVYVPGATPLPVVDVQGANVFIGKVNDVGNNDAFKDLDQYEDPYNARARSMYGKTYSYIYPAPNDKITIGSNNEGMFAFDLADRTNINVFANQSAPWDYWNLEELKLMVAAVNNQTGGSYNADVINGQSLLSNPNMGPTQSAAYLDTIHGYLNPRIVMHLQLEGNEVLGVNNKLIKNINLEIYPNPSKGNFVISSSELNEGSGQVTVKDISGKVILTLNQVQNNQSININHLPVGTYLLSLETEKGISNKLIMKSK